MARLIYLGKLGDAAGRHEEEVTLPASVADTAQLRRWLDERHATDGAFSDASVRIAINDALARDPAPVGEGDTLAFLPPVGGG